MQCRTLSKQRPCGWADCEREECKTANTILRIRESQEAKDMTEQQLIKDHQALTRLYRLIGNQPGYAVFSVKQILGALSEDE